MSWIAPRNFAAKFGQWWELWSAVFGVHGSKRPPRVLDQDLYIADQSKSREKRKHWILREWWSIYAAYSSFV